MSEALGWIEVICGCMFSGKTEELQRRLKRLDIAKVPFKLFKPQNDDRYDADKVCSHSGEHTPASSVGRQETLGILDAGRDVPVIAFDEVQFFGPDIVDVAVRFAMDGKRVIVAGLDLDCWGRPFGPMPNMLAVAEKITKLQAVCVRCGSEKATRSLRTTGGLEQVQVGAAESYEALCFSCFTADPASILE